MVKKYLIPEGTRDLILKDCNLKKKLQKDIEEIFEKWGYDEIVTPTIEFYQTFNSGFQKLKEEDVYKFFDAKGRILVLRPDMTIPIARVVATKFKEVEAPIRLRYCADVFRVHQSLGGKKNEYTDCGIELIGLDAEKSDLEILVTALETMQLLKNTNSKLEIGNINFFNSAVKDLDLDDEEKQELAELIDRKASKELEDFLNKYDIDENYKEFLKELPWLFGGREAIDRAKGFAINSELMENIKYLEVLADDLAELGYGDQISFDLGMVPRLDYYTGIIFKGYADGAGATILSGGRYDHLMSTFGKDMPAIGFSVNLDMMMNAMENEEQEKIEKIKVYYGKQDEISVIKKAIYLRKEGKIVELCPVEGMQTIEVEKDVK